MFVYAIIGAAAMAGVTQSDKVQPIDAPPRSVIYAPVPDMKPHPVPEGNPGAWVNPNDYPSRALQERREGLVSFRLEVSASGVVSKCEVTNSSGHLDLDTTACDMIYKRAHFIPAKNRKGEPIVGYYQNRVRWVLPKTIQVPKPGQVTMYFIIEKNGSVSDCKFTTTFANAQKEDVVCNEMPTFDIPLDANGNPVRKSVSSSTVMIVKDIPDTDVPGTTKTGN